MTNQSLEYNLKALLVMRILEYYIEICYFQYKTVRDQSPTETTEFGDENKRHLALMKANLIMNRHFDN